MMGITLTRIFCSRMKICSERITTFYPRLVISTVSSVGDHRDGEGNGAVYLGLGGEGRMGWLGNTKLPSLVICSNPWVSPANIH